jgi:putative transcriptional regulator
MLNIYLFKVEIKRLMMYIECEVMKMLKLRLREVMFEKRWNARQLSEATGIRWNSIDDMMENRSKRWTVENLEKIMEVLELKDITELIEYVEKTTEA